MSFARGLRIEMELDEDQFTGGGAFLFANVLERFFGSQRIAEQLYPAQRHDSAEKGGTARMATEIGPETSRLKDSPLGEQARRGRVFALSFSRRSRFCSGSAPACGRWEASPIPRRRRCISG